MRITAQLIDATTGGHLWSERYDRPFKDIFALQDEIVQKIVTTLKLQLTLQEQGWIVRKHTDNLEAYDSFLRGMEYYWRYTKEANAQARQMFEKAIALDPQYAEAYAWLGATYYLEWVWRWSADPQTLERALALAQQALALDDSLPIAHSLLSYVYAQKQQYDQAMAEGERAIALDPNNADSYAWQAEVLNFAGRPEEALQDGGAGDAPQPPLSAPLLIRIGLGLPLDRAVCRGGRHAEGSCQPEPQSFWLPTSSWLSATWSSGPLNRVRMPRRWRRRWRRRNGSLPSMTPPPWVTQTLGLCLSVAKAV